MDKNLAAIKSAKLTSSLKKSSGKENLSVNPKKSSKNHSYSNGESEYEDAHSDIDEEDLKDYKPGGYCPIEIGDKLKDNRYIITRKLGWGHFSTVWLAKDEEEKRFCAIKIVKSARQYNDAALDEISLLLKVNSSDPNSSDRPYVLTLLDNFTHTSSNGLHQCMVFEVLGENLLALIRKYPDGLPLAWVKGIAKQALKGLSYLHEECGIIHTDLKLENVLLCVDKGEEEREPNGSSKKDEKDEVIKLSKPISFFDKLEREFKAERNGNETTPSNYKEEDSLPKKIYSTCPFQIQICDLGNACWTTHHFTDGIQTRQYRAPEVILGAPWDQSADIWSLACLIMELLTGEYLFDPRSGAKFDKDDDHLAQIIELLGPLPKNMIRLGRNSKEFFNKKGTLKRISSLKHWGLYDVLVDKYEFHQEEAKEITSLLLPMLELSIEKRAKAKDLINHSWLRE